MHRIRSNLDGEGTFGEEIVKSKYQKVSQIDLSSALDNLYRNFPRLLERIYFKEGETWETICGAISGEIASFLRRNEGLESHYCFGDYFGRGTQFSGGTKGTPHCWVELWIVMTRAGLDNKRMRIIIDGAYAQFYPTYTPLCIKRAVRLMIFINDPHANRWYKIDNINQGWETIPLRKLKTN